MENDIFVCYGLFHVYAQICSHEQQYICKLIFVHEFYEKKSIQGLLLKQTSSDPTKMKLLKVGEYNWN